jgi:hypothetical protein
MEGGREKLESGERAMTGSYVAFDTNVFRTEQTDAEIDNFLLGGDLAEWLHAELCRQNDVTSHWEPLEEDWGWTFGVRAAGAKFWINIWHADSWIIGLEMKPGLLGVFRRAKTAGALSALQNIVSRVLATPDSKNVKWYDHWPEERLDRGETH